MKTVDVRASRMNVVCVCFGYIHTLSRRAIYSTRVLMRVMLWRRGDRATSIRLITRFIAIYRVEIRDICETRV